MKSSEDIGRPIFFALISLPATAIGFALSVQMASLSWILSNKFGLKIDEVGLVWAAGPLTGIIGQILFGFLSDKIWFYGRRRPFIILGGIVSSIMLFTLPRIDQVSAALGFANITIIAAVVVFLLDFSINIGFNPARSLIADVTQPGMMRIRGYSWMQTISGMGGVLAYIIGALAGNYILIDTGIVVVLLLAVVSTLFIREPRELLKKNDTVFIADTDSRLLGILVAHGFSWLGVFTMFVYMFAFVQNNLFAKSIGQAMIVEQSGKIINISFMIMNIIGFILPAAIFIPLIRKFGRIPVHGACILIMSIGYFLLFFATDPFQVYFLMLPVGIGWAAIVTIPFAIISEIVAREKMGFFMGLYNLSVVLPQLFVTLVLSYVVHHLKNTAGIFLISAGCLFISFILWFRSKMV
jgi:maltose/moltooligosaccharide transporter